MKNSRIALMALALTSSVAFAGPKAPAPQTFIPEIAYAYYTRSSSDVRISNREGTAAMLLYRGAQGAVGQIDMAPRSSQMVAFVIPDPANQFNKLLQLQSWTVDAAGRINLNSVRTLTQGKILFIDFSPDGRAVAFTVYDGVNFSIRIADVATGDLRQVGVPVNNIQNLTWSGDGKYLFYHVPSSLDGVTRHTIYRLALNSDPTVTAVPEVVAVERSINDLDTARRTSATGEGDTGLILSIWREELGENFPIGGWDGRSLDASGRPSLNFFGPRGVEVHYSCDNGSFIYREQGQSTAKVTKVHNIAQNVGTIFSTDGNIRRLDWNNC